MTERCYLCGSVEKLTRDHIPPKNLFPEPRPSNLITVPCCYPCNNQSSKEDEYFRLAASCLMNSNATGKHVWRQKVVSSTLKKRRIGTLLDELRKNIKDTVVQTPIGDVPAGVILVSVEPIQRVLIRITKGLLSIVHPEVASRDLDYEITQLDQFKLNNGCMEPIEKHFTYFERGDGVYRCWRGLADIDTSYGLWVHMFYDSAAFMVQHKRAQATNPEDAANPESIREQAGYPV